MPDTSMLEKLNQKLEKSEKKLRKAINDEKALQHQLKQLTRKERTHRPLIITIGFGVALIIVGGILGYNYHTIKKKNITLVTNVKEASK